MSDPTNTTTPSNEYVEATASSLARGTLYMFLSAVFSSPDSEKFRILGDDSFRAQVRRSCDLQGDPQMRETVHNLFDAVACGRALVSEEYIAVFGHTLSRSATPYELEGAKNKDVFAITQSLADIKGFYRAFGLEIQPEERADHVSVEAEFLGYLLLKESLALEKGQAENAAVCAGARTGFWNDHFSHWMPRFAACLAAEPSAHFYRDAARFLERFVRSEAEINGAAVLADQQT